MDEIARLHAALRVCEVVLHRQTPTVADLHAAQQAAGAYDTAWKPDDVGDDLPHMPPTTAAELASAADIPWSTP